MRAGPKLGVDAFSISNYGSAMFAQVQPQHSRVLADASILSTNNHYP